MSIKQGGGDGCVIWDKNEKDMVDSPRKATLVTFKKPAPKPPARQSTPRPVRTSRSYTRLTPCHTERLIRRPSVSPCTLKNRRSISLENLTPRKTQSGNEVYQKSSDRHGQRLQQPELVNAEGIVDDVEFDRHAALRICQVLILNAWRKERNRVKAMAHENSLTISKVDDFKKQSSALRQLLDTEKFRMSNATTKVNELSEMLENSSTKLDEIFEQKDEREAKLVDYEIKIVKLETNNENQAENFRITQAFYDKQEQKLSQERIVIDDLKKGNQVLQDTIDNDDKTIVLNNETIQKLTRKISGLELDLSKALHNVAARKAKREEKQEKKQKLREENAKLTHDYELSVHERDIILRQIKISKMVNEEKDFRATEIEKCLQEKERDIMFLRHQLYEFELQEAAQSWRNQARYLARRMKPVMVYILTRRVT